MLIKNGKIDFTNNKHAYGFDYKNIEAINNHNSLLENNS